MSSNLATHFAIWTICSTVAAGCSNEAPPSSALTASYHAPTATPLSCVPTLDGTIQTSQFQFAVGAPENFLVSPAGQNETVDLVPALNANGRDVWDYRSHGSTEQLAQVTVKALGSQWYASSFPSGQYVVPFDLADTEEAIYSEDSQTVWLYGFASTDESPSTGQTLLQYDQPIPAYQFPLSVGSSWTATQNIIDGTLDGLPWAETDTYAFDIDASGVLELPDLTFTQVLRLRTVLTQAPAVGAQMVTRQTSMLFQCFGEVYRATSLPNETDDNFTTAAGVRGLSLETQP